MSTTRVRLIDDPATLMKAAEAMRPILARKAAHDAGDHHLCRPDTCEHVERGAA